MPLVSSVETCSLTGSGTMLRSPSSAASLALAAFFLQDLEGFDLAVFAAACIAVSIAAFICYSCLRRLFYGASAVMPFPP